MPQANKQIKFFEYQKKKKILTKILEFSTEFFSSL